MNESVLPKRSGSRPRTTSTNPHTQLEQNPERQVVDELARRVFAIPDVEERPSAISVPEARAFVAEGGTHDRSTGSVYDRSGIRSHPPMPDGNLHAALPPEVAQEAIGKGWE
jgi:hypothetical protein